MTRLTRDVMNAYYQRDTEALQRLTGAAEVQAAATLRRIQTLADALADMGEVPRAWLRQAIEAHFNGKPVPPMHLDQDA